MTQSEDQWREVAGALCAHGAPLVVEPLDSPPPVSVALSRALEFAHQNATVLRVLPVVLVKNSPPVPLSDFAEAARTHNVVREFGMLAELTGQLTGRDEYLAVAASLFTEMGEPRSFFGETSAWARQLEELRTPAVCRRWGFLMNMTERSFLDMLRKHSPEAVGFAPNFRT